MANIFRTAGVVVLVAGFGAVIAPSIFTGIPARDFDWSRAADETAPPTASRDFDWPVRPILLDRETAARDFDWPAARHPRMAEAEALMKAGAWEEAAALLERVVEESPDDADAYSYLGFCDRMLGDREQALAQFGRALAIDPAHRSALEYLGRLYLEMRDLPRAKEQLGALARLCGGTCGQYRDLQEEVQKFKANERRG